MSLVQAVPPSVLFDLLLTENTVIYNTIAASAFFFWEYCITFAEEVDLVWRWNWSSVTVLFIAIRYLAFGIRMLTTGARSVELIFYANLTGLIKPSIQTCQRWVNFEVISGHCLALSVDILLAIRTHALYGRSRIMLAILITILVVSQGFAISILTKVLPKFVATPLPLPPRIHVGACVVLGADPNFPNYLIPTLVSESSFFFLVLIKFVHSKVTTKTHTSHMLVVFLRDGFWAFALVFAVLVWSLVTYKVNPVKGDIAITWLFSTLAFAGTRLIINLRSEAPSRKTPDAMELQIVSPVSPLSPQTMSSTSRKEQQELFGGVMVTRSKIVADDDYFSFEK